MGEKWIAVVGSLRREKNTDLIVDYVNDKFRENMIKRIRNYKDFY